MKKLTSLLLCLVASASLAIPAAAQGYGYVTLSVPEVIGTEVTTNVAQTIDVRKAEFVAIQATFNMTGAATSTNAFVFEKSVDGSNWTTTTDSDSYASWSVIQNGTTEVSAIKLISANGVGYLRLKSIANPDASESVTNLTVRYSLKLLTQK